MNIVKIASIEKNHYLEQEFKKRQTSIKFSDIPMNGRMLDRKLFKKKLTQDLGLGELKIFLESFQHKQK